MQRYEGLGWEMVQKKFGISIVTHQMKSDDG
jgi:hypothetical protein